jgi:hypothetical protein
MRKLINFGQSSMCLLHHYRLLQPSLPHSLPQDVLSGYSKLALVPELDHQPFMRDAGDVVAAVGTSMSPAHSDGRRSLNKRARGFFVEALKFIFHGRSKRRRLWYIFLCLVSSPVAGLLIYLCNTNHSFQRGNFLGGTLVGGIRTHYAYANYLARHRDCRLLGSYTPMFYISSLKASTTLGHFSVPSALAIAFMNCLLLFGRQKLRRNPWKVKEATSKQSTEIDFRILGWTVHILREGGEHGRVFEAILVFFFKSDKDKVFRDQAQKLIEDALGSFLRDTRSSNSVPESVKIRRLMTCFNAAGEVLPPVLITLRNTFGGDDPCELGRRVSLCLDWTFYKIMGCGQRWTVHPAHTGGSLPSLLRVWVPPGRFGKRISGLSNARRQRTTRQFDPFHAPPSPCPWRSAITSNLTHAILFPNFSAPSVSFGMKLSNKPRTVVRIPILYFFSRTFGIIISLGIESLVLPRVGTSMLPAAISQAVWLTRRRKSYPLCNVSGHRSYTTHVIYPDHDKSPR